jgi:hypothetical protein
LVASLELELIEPKPFSFIEALALRVMTPEGLSSGALALRTRGPADFPRGRETTLFEE